MSPKAVEGRLEGELTHIREILPSYSCAGNRVGPMYRTGPLVDYLIRQKAQP